MVESITKITVTPEATEPTRNGSPVISVPHSEQCSIQ